MLGCFCLAGGGDSEDEEKSANHYESEYRKHMLIREKQKSETAKQGSHDIRKLPADSESAD